MRSVAIWSFLKLAHCDGGLDDGARAMANLVRRALSIGEAWWQDIDTPQMPAWAKEKLRARDTGFRPVTVSARLAQRDALQD